LVLTDAMQYFIPTTLTQSILMLLIAHFMLTIAIGCGLRFDIQKFLIGRELRLLAGISYNHIRTGPEEISNIESNIPNRSLYENYIQWGIIGKQEASGGDLGYLTLGLIYDTRNEQSNCTDGRWLETFLVISPGIFDTPGFSKLIFTYRHYHSFFQNRLTLTGRASIQNKLSGKIPFYFLPVYMDSRQNQDGIGGAFKSQGGKSQPARCKWLFNREF
jgi:outer membrane protein assembly factor BamA